MTTTPGPDDGHLFSITVTGTISSKVVGDEHYTDFGWAPDPIVLSVRAWNLPDALRQAAEQPLSAWEGFGED